MMMIYEIYILKIFFNLHTNSMKCMNKDNDDDDDDDDVERIKEV